MQSAETHGKYGLLVDSSIWSAHCHHIDISILGTKLAPTLYLDVQKQATILPGSSLSILL